MKKVTLLLVAALCSMAAMAAQYSGSLSVEINGVVSTQDNVLVNITDNGNGTYNLSLNNFVLVQDGENYAVGNILVDNLLGVKGGSMTALGVTRNILIPEGDLAGIDTWLGPLLGEVPIALTAIFNDTDANVHIDIDMRETALQQMIVVDFKTPRVDKAPVRGDMDNSGIVDVDDVNEIINIILSK